MRRAFGGGRLGVVRLGISGVGIDVVVVVVAVSVVVLVGSAIFADGASWMMAWLGYCVNCTM